MVVAIVYGMFAARRSVVAEFGSDQAQQQWNTWRERAAADADREGPVQRRVNETAEPPALILMRDYFSVCLVFAVAMSSLLYGALALMIVGAIAKPDTNDPDSVSGT